jgi:hypothetical protein
MDTVRVGRMENREPVGRDGGGEWHLFTTLPRKVKPFISAKAKTIPKLFQTTFVSYQRYP